MKTYTSVDYPGTFRMLRVGETIKHGDKITSKDNPVGLGWIPAQLSVGDTVMKDDSLYFFRAITSRLKQPRRKQNS